MNHRVPTPLLVVICLVLCGACFGEATDTAAPDALAEEGRIADARAAQERLADRLSSDLGPDDPATLAAWGRLIELRSADGDLDGARQLVDLVLQHKAPALGLRTHMEPPPGVAHWIASLGELKAAQDHLEDSLVEMARILGGGHASTRILARALVRLVHARGDHDAAQALEARLFGSEDAPAVQGPRPPESERDPTRRRPLPGIHQDPPDAPTRGTKTQGTGPNRGGPLGAEAFFDRLGERMARPTWEPETYELPDFIRAGIPEQYRSGQWGHFALFEQVLAFPNPEAAFEILERYRTTGLQVEREGGTGVLARLRWAEKGPAGEPDDWGRLRFLGPRLDALTRAVDRLGDPGSDAHGLLIEERERLQRWRFLVLRRRFQQDDAHLWMPVRPRDVRPHLDPGTVLLSYAQSTADSSVVFALRREGNLQWKRLDVGTEDLALQVERFLDSIGTGKDDAPPPPAAASRPLGLWLYERLLAPVEEIVDGAERVVILADGPLHRLPFGALVRPAEGDRPEQYVVEWKPVVRAQSAAVWMELRKRQARDDRDRRSGSRRLVAFGDPVYPEPAGDGGGGGPRRSLPPEMRGALERGLVDGFERLAGSAREVETVAAGFDDARILLGEDATEERAKALLPGADYIHVAAHGVVDDERPDDSFLALTVPPGLPQGRENGVLQAWEVIDQLWLDAELVALSACVTAAGSDRQGEGPMSLARAFQAAGARSVLASLWQVNDASTAELMIRFYRHHLGGASKAEALRAAQVELLRGEAGLSEDASSPYHWAAFQLLGDWK
ncbi:MAG: CHAT domain-containing tetratricopeptide repeat protein [Acidobacteriota bacterium]